MSIANNHLSKHGRFGDTEIAKTSTGDLWHVNKHEKKLIDNYGKIGEDVVDILGSGTINPTTGLKEQFLTAALTAAQFGLSLYQGAKQTKMERDNSSSKFGLTSNALNDLEKAQSNLQTSVTAQKEFTTEQFQSDINKLGKNTGKTLSDIQTNINQSKSKTNLAYSGQLEKLEKDSSDKVREQAEDSSSDLITKFGLKMGDIIGGFESEKSKLKSQKERLEYEKSLYSDMSNNKFLGIF